MVGSSCSSAVDEPIFVPINGIVQPPVMPSPGCRGRVTNQLQFLKKNVLEKIWNHDYAKPFRKPVDTIEHNIPDYYKVITNPMDLGTIRKRLSNRYYWSSEDCIKDFKKMFKNCYTYNDPGQDVVVMAQTLEKIFYQKLARMPKKESEVRRESGKIGDRSRASFDASVTSRSLEASPREFSKEKTSDSLPIHNYQFQSTIEAESTVKNVEVDSSVTKHVTTEFRALLERRRSHRGEFREELSPGLKNCRKILKNLFRKRHSEYAWPFYLPLDAKRWKFDDYHDVIKKPIDLLTIKCKLDDRMYATPQEFIEDVRLIFSNCYKYDCRKYKLVSNAQQLQHVFEMMLSKVYDDREEIELDEDSSDSSSSSSSSNSCSSDAYRSRSNSSNINNPDSFSAETVEGMSPKF